uniref:hypothetical protein n=1 Tax=Citrobacter freundii TaxID=546 RepID=UPI002018199E|nr:hypothetical protein [Citrobacter freundii]
MKKPMKNSVKYLVVGLGLALSPLTHADENDCQLTVSQSEVNYTQLRREDVVTTQQSWHKMAEREITVNASCPENVQMGVQALGAAGEKGRFQFGQKGGVAFKVSHVTVDGKEYSAGKTVDQINLTPESGSGAAQYIHSNDVIVAVENNAVPAGKQMSFKVILFPVLNDSAFSDNSDETALEADITWQLLTRAK